ncbi:DUF341 domain-containing protein [Viridothelium virens]|uniref:DUF341 domain-containing protein n=1 Tax=Viridothelium virens TaxID=1048519 RepID=A0A6A6GUB3_VIRVR|nr:DUF341 domain-containing protein [Viridothelium virens]
MRFLCLHGMGTNSKVCKACPAALRSEICEPHVHKFEFVDGELQWPPAPGSETLNLGPDECLAYYDSGSASSILEAIKDLDAYVKKAGPFDGILGFSQGAVLAAMLLARHGCHAPFSLAIFICADIPFSEQALKKGVVELLEPGKEEEPVILVPSAHIYGARDPDVEHAHVLAKLCQDYGRVTYDHGAGHEIPRSPSGVTDEMTDVIQNVILKATLGQ